ncbi:MAG: hypothetical protein K1X55_15695 [Chitinophagales bacterium]|nr:hypothetical protein [Chitinophagales bacterium]
MQTLQPELKNLLQLAYSAERAASFAYQGHAGSIRKNQEVRAKIHEIEMDEWFHRAEVLKIMQEYQISVNKWYELKYYVIGKTISWSCYVLGWFIPHYFAGRLESGNVVEYFHMKDYFNQIGITKHDDILVEMGIKEKEHEVYFLQQIRQHPWLPIFERIFRWGVGKSYNDVEL